MVKGLGFRIARFIPEIGGKSHRVLDGGKLPLQLLSFFEDSSKQRPMPDSVSPLHSPNRYLPNLRSP